MNAEAPRPLIYKDGKTWIIARDGRGLVEIKKPAVPPPSPPPKAQSK
ncbi:hypothetical protein [Treponema endosymbiont of Eucomonympha sp.]|nr:hypothetical protein [Treponema endosymbiont of Eucomonympha sp.]